MVVSLFKGCFSLGIDCRRSAKNSLFLYLVVCEKFFVSLFGFINKEFFVLHLQSTPNEKQPLKSETTILAKVLAFRGVLYFCDPKL